MHGIPNGRVVTKELASGNVTFILSRSEAKESVTVTVTFMPNYGKNEFL